MFFAILTFIHVIICFLLVVAVLLQSGKGGGLASSIGGGLSSTSVLGGRAASDFLTKATSVLATAFMVSCLLLSLTFDSGDSGPVSATERAMQESPVQPSVVPFTEPEGGGVLPTEGDGAAAPAEGDPAPAADAGGEESATGGDEQPAGE